MFQTCKIKGCARLCRCRGCALMASRCGSSRHWGTTSGDKAKFGLRASEIVAVVDVLAGAGMLSCLKLLHFHAGSQVRLRFAVRPAREAPCAGPNTRHSSGL